MSNKLSKEALEYFVNLIENKEDVSGKFVVTSLRTREDYTYKIKAKKKGESYFIDILIESGYNSFKKVGYWYDGKVTMLSHLNSGIVINFAINGAEWFLKYMMKKDFDYILQKTKVEHTGTCLKCGRELTDAASIEYGMGPICRGFDVLRNRED